MPKVYEVFGCMGYTDINRPLFGVECEIESVRDIKGGLSALWRITEDGSLRNNGHEFISIPMYADDQISGFRELHSKLVYRNPQDAFSERTSIHVHMNVQNMDVEEVKTLTLLYAMFEPVFFDMVEPKRKHNIHCVPLTDTYLPSYYRSPFKILHSRWQKYTALNLVPITTQGTVEFRHMHGHSDTVLFAEWLKVLGNLDTTTRAIGQLTRDHVSQSDWIERTYRSLFFGTSVYHKHLHQFNKTCFNQIMDVKLAFV